MSESGLFGLSTGGIAAGATAVVVAVGGTIYYQSQRAPDPVPTDPPVAVSQPAPAPTPAPAPEPAPAVAEPTPETTVEEPPATAPEPQPIAPKLIPPSFDLVRVDAEGGALVAGLAPPKFDVAIELDGTEVARTRADKGGSFAALFDVEPSTAARVIYLVAYASDGTSVRSEDSVIIAPRPVIVAEAEPEPTVAPEPEPTVTVEATPEPEPTVTVEATPEPEPTVTVEATPEPEPTITVEATPEPEPKPELIPQVATIAAPTDRATAALSDASAVVTGGGLAAQSVADAMDADALTAAATATPTATATALTAAPTAAAASPAAISQAPTILLAGKSGVRVLQASEDQQNARDNIIGVVIDSIGYSAEGEVTVAGQAPQDGAANVRIYLNNEPIADVPVAADNQFEIELPEVDAGIYTLRVDQIDDDGAVVSRFETPFKREDRETLADLAPRLSTKSSDVAAAVITVQPGFTLWGIASERYGDGFQYVKVFEANQTQIRDPDLIYPGQVFDLPD